MRKNNSLLLSGPYIAWMVVFTLIPLGVVGYYALTDPNTGELAYSQTAEQHEQIVQQWRPVWEEYDAQNQN